MHRRTLIAGLAVLPVAGAAEAQPALDPENTILMDIKGGQVVIQLLPELAPKHVERIKTLMLRRFI